MFKFIVLRKERYLTYCGSYIYTEIVFRTQIYIYNDEREIERMK